MKSFFRIAALGLALSMFMTWGSVAGEDAAATVEGFFTANGEKVELPYAYAYRASEGFYDENDPTWKLLFVEQPVAEADLDDVVWGAAYVRLGVTKTAEFDDEPAIQVYSQDIRLSADQGGNLSGGSYPEIEITSIGPERIAGHVYHPEVQEFFDDTFQYDFVFDLPLSDPFAAKSAGATVDNGEPLGEGGGEPGTAFLAWCDAVHSGELDRIKPLLSAEQAAMLEGEEGLALFEEGLELIQIMTPTDIEILGGSSNGETAILQVKGSFDGEPAKGEITMELMDGRWVNTNASWE